jgi:hypothetical protein
VSNYSNGIRIGLLRFCGEASSGMLLFFTGEKKLIDLPEALQISEKAENQMKDREFHVNSVQVYNFAQKSDCSSHDCEFISLAEDLNTKLITMDKQILRSFPELCAKPLDVLNL